MIVLEVKTGSCREYKLPREDQTSPSSQSHMLS